MAKITDQDYLTACKNPDGSYSLTKAAQWLIEATTGKPLSTEEAEKLVAEALTKAKARRISGSGQGTGGDGS